MSIHGISRIVKTGATATVALLLCIGFADFDATAKKKRATGKAKTTQRAHKKSNSREILDEAPVTYIRIVDESEVKHEVLTQDEQQEDSSPRAIVNQEGEYEPVFSVTEVQAQFPGGMQALMNWLAGHLAYPEEAWKNNIQGRVIVQFIVNADGSVSEARVVKSVDKYLDAEALRVVGMMPKWIPGKNAGKVVRSYFILPISFKIPEEEIEENAASYGVISDVCQDGNAMVEKTGASEPISGTQAYPEVYNGDDAKKENGSDCFFNPELPAQFPGGQKALMQWVDDNLEYPECVKESGEKKRVIVKFVIEKDGTVTSPSIVKGVDPELDKAAIGLMEKMPSWIPGKMNGEPVRSSFILPILFNRGK